MEQAAQTGMPFVVPAIPVNSHDLPHVAGSLNVRAQNDSSVASQQPLPFQPTFALTNQSESGMDISAILPVQDGSNDMFSESGSLNLTNWSSNPIEMSSETAKAMELVLGEIDAHRKTDFVFFWFTVVTSY